MARETNTVEQVREKVQEVFHVLEHGTEIQKMYLIQELTKALPQFIHIWKRRVGGEEEYNRLLHLKPAIFVEDVHAELS